MSWKNSSDRYGWLSIGMHWSMLLLLVAVYLFTNLADAFPKGSDVRAAMKTWHYMLGLCVFLLVFVRLAIRLASGPAPQVEPETPGWQRRVAGWTHVALYLFMIGMPLLGWLALSAAGKPVPYFGLRLPALIGESRSVARYLKEIHEVIGTTGYGLIGLHSAAALYHHYVMRDNTFVRMLPPRARNRRPAP